MSSQTESSSPTRPPKKRRFPRKRFALLILFALLVIGGLLSYAPLVKWGLREGLKNGVEPLGFAFIGVKDISVQLGRPIRLSEVTFGPLPDAPPTSQTRIVIGEAEIALATLWSLISDRDHLLDRITLRKVDAMLDFRATSLPPPKLMPSLSTDQQKLISQTTQFSFPRQIGIENSDARILADGQYYELNQINAAFYERRMGKLQVGYSKIRTDSGIALDIVNASAVTALNKGALYLGEFAISPNAQIQSFTADLARPGGPGLSASVTLGAGWLRLEAGFGEKQGEPFLDASAWAGQIDTAELSHLLNLQTPAEGILTTGQFVFRGVPGKELDGDASLQLSAVDFRWQSRGWKKLEFVGGWTHRQIFVSNFSLAQQDNLIAFSGKLGLGQGAFDLAKATFSLECKGDVRDLTDLADLAGESLRDTKGQASFAGELRGAQGQYDGNFDAKADKITVRGTPLGALQLAVKAKGGEVFLENFEVKNGKDSLTGKGTFQVASPNQYTASLLGKILDVNAYSELIPALKELQATGGLDLDWQGDGSTAAHSGAFNLKLRDLVLPWTPQGIVGTFVGTYSPESIYFSEIDLQREALRLTFQLSLGKGGIFANHILLGSGNQSLLAGQFYAPYNPLALLAKKPWREGILPDKSLYADLRSRAVPIVELAALTGQSAPMDGDIQFSLKASGPILDPLMEASAEWKNLRLLIEGGGEIAPFQGKIDLRSEKGKAAVIGQVRAPLLDPIQIAASFPLGFVEAADGSLQLADPNGPLEGTIVFPKTPLRLFAPFVAGVRNLDGQLSGSVNLSNNLSAPRINGSAELNGGRLDFGPNAPSFQAVQGRLTFTGADAQLEYLRGTIGAGPFTLTGNVNFSDPKKIRYQAALKGEKILLARDANVRLRANIDLRADGTPESGSVEGSIRLVDGRIFRRLEITPLLISTNTSAAPMLLPNLAGLVPPPFGSWKLNVSLDNETPFLLAGNIATGSIEPKLQILGTLVDPRPEGEVVLRNARAFLPFSVVDIPEGRIFLRADNPRVPILDVRGNSRVLEYNIQAYAFGPLDEGNLILRSDPPLQQESIILMLTTGLAPGALSGAGFGEAAIGQGGLLLLRAFVRQFDSEKVDLESLVNRLQVQAVPPITQGDPATLRGEFRLFDQLSLISERDAYGFFNAGVTYTLRLK